MRLFGKFTKWCESHLDTFIAVLTIVAGVVGFFFNIQNPRNSNDIFSIALLIIIAVNLISIIHRYLRKHGSQLDDLIQKSTKLILIKSDIEDIKNRLDIIKPQTSSLVELRTRHNCKSILDIIEGAKHELFISGINLHTLSGYVNKLLLRADEGVKIKILVLDVYDAKLLKSHEHMVNHSIKGPRSTLVILRHLLNNDNIEVKQADFIMPAMFMAYDRHKPYGYIKVEHFLISNDNSELPNIELTPDKDWYINYKLQTEYLWNRGKPYDPKEKK